MPKEIVVAVIGAIALVVTGVIVEIVKGILQNPQNKGRMIIVAIVVLATAVIVVVLLIQGTESTKPQQATQVDSSPVVATSIPTIVSATTATTQDNGGSTTISSSSIAVSGTASAIAAGSTIPDVTTPILSTNTPENGQIAFVSNLDGNYEIYLINATGGQPRNLTRNPAGDYSPAWSPDGQHIVFLSDRDRNGYSTPDQPYNEIYVMKIDGSEQTRLTYTSADEGVPAWSPDGTRIAFQSNRTGGWEIYVMNADSTGDPTRLTYTGEENTFPAWSPDGLQIAFQSYRNGHRNIYIMKADGSDQPTRLTQIAEDERGPAWSADGQYIAFSSNRDGSWAIYVTDANGRGEPTRIASTPDNEWIPTWSPDGRHIAFHIGDNRRSIYIMNNDGGQRTVLIDNGTDNYWPAWSPIPR